MDSDQTYGVPRVRAELIDAGVHASRKRIARLMRQGHMRGVSRRRSYVVTTQRDKRQRSAPDLVNRRFVAKDINELWVADMTYIPTWAGFLYLAMVLDVYSRKVVGWAFGERMTAELVLEALNMALHTRKPGAAGKSRQRHTHFATSCERDFSCVKIAARFFIAKCQKPDDWTRRASGFLKLLVSLGELVVTASILSRSVLLCKTFVSHKTWWLRARAALARLRFPAYLGIQKKG